MSSNTTVAVKGSASISNDDDSTVVLEPSISLKQFPPKLRKLGKYLLKTDEKLSITEACNKINIDRATALTEIWRAKKKGNDFYKFLEDVSDTLLNANLLAVDSATIEGAVSGTHNDRKLYYQRIGKLTEVTGNTQVHLAIGVNITGVVPQDQTREKGVLDTEAFIPKGK